MDKDLEKLRVGIDALDKEIQLLIEKRAELASQVAIVKRAENKANTNFYRPEREAQVLQSVIKRNNSLIKDKDIACIFREIMSACLAIEQKINVAYLGPQGTFTQEATLKHFGQAVSMLDCTSIDEVFQEVEKNNANYGVVPIENSSNGVIGASIDMLYSQNLKICGEVEISIHHQLMMLDESKNIEIVYAHQQAFDQCRRWLNNHYPKAQLKAVASNALAAQLVKDNLNAAAIASEVALDLYNLKCVAKNIEDKVNNTTRFLVLGKDSIPPSGNDKTSLLIVAKHEAGALFDLLLPFKEKNINILQLARHPISGVKWEYLFLIDVEGHQQQEHLKNALEQVAKKVSKMDILGSYPVMTF